MSWSRSRRALFILPFLTFLISPASADDTDVDLRLTNVFGTVYVRLSNESDEDWIVAEADTPLENGDVIKTMAGASAEVSIDGDTVVLLDEITEFKADSLTNRLTRFFLSWGSLTAKIRTFTNPEDQLQIQTPIAVVAVRGTELAVTSQGADQPTVVGVFDEGKVFVETSNGTIWLEAGEETEIARGAPPLPRRPLKHFAPMRPRILHARERARMLHAHWRPLPLLERRDKRKLFTNRPRVRSGPDQAPWQRKISPQRRTAPRAPRKNK